MPEGKYFTICSLLNGMVLDIAEGSNDPGTQVFTWEEHGGINQLWYHEPISNTIRSKMNDFCIECLGG